MKQLITSIAAIALFLGGLCFTAKMTSTYTRSAMVTKYSAGRVTTVDGTGKQWNFNTDGRVYKSGDKIRIIMNDNGSIDYPADDYMVEVKF